MVIHIMICTNTTIARETYNGCMCVCVCVCVCVAEEGGMGFTASSAVPLAVMVQTAVCWERGTEVAGPM